MAEGFAEEEYVKRTRLFSRNLMVHVRSTVAIPECFKNSSTFVDDTCT